jgi:Lysozyme like domain
MSFVEEGTQFHVKLSSKILHQFMRHRGSFVKCSAFIVVSVLILTVLMHANVDAITGQVQTSRRQVVQSLQQNPQRERQKVTNGGSIFPVTHTATPTIVPTPEPAHSSAFMPNAANTPTPAPTTTPPSTPANNATGNSGGDVTTIINQVFGANAPEALNVARCESGLNPAARNPNVVAGSYPAGLFQILYPSTWSTTPEAGLSPYDATANAEAAYAIFTRDGNSWREWSCAA